MQKKTVCFFALVSSLSAFAASASATTVSFTESFDTGASSWRNSLGTADATWIAGGGADGGGYITQVFNFLNSNTTDPPPVLVRGQSNFGSSGNNFFGNWIADGVTEFQFAVRHDAPVPMNFFSRFALPAGFPGAVGVEFVPVLPNTWTPISIAIDPANPEFISFEGSDFATVFGNIGRVQLGVTVPQALVGVDQPFSFDFDVVSIVPEPASATFFLGAFGLALLRRR